jgi:NADH-quinone oxidoreductase subunit N
MVMAILPEISLLVLAAVVLVVDLIISEEHKDKLPWLTVAGLVLSIVITLLFARPNGAPELIWGGMLRHDWLGFSFKLLFLFGAMLTSLFSAGWERLGKQGEFYLLLVISTLGMNLMGSAADLIMLFLAIETTSIPLYIMAGFMTADKKSTESGIKYLLFGAMTTAIMLYGFTLLFGISGETNLYAMAEVLVTGDTPHLVLYGILLLVLVGFAFKVSMVPFHFWAPDVYEGAPTPVTGFLSTASKAAGFAVLTRFLLTVFPEGMPDWAMIMAIGALLSMTIGNTLAIPQKNIKRLLAYSSIAHAGYILIGVAAATSLGVTSILYYLIAYLISNLAAFGVVIIFYRVVGSDAIEDYSGLSRRSPLLSLAMLIAFLSLAGVPPLGGFIAKVLVFASAVDAGMVWLAVAGVLNAIIGLYYYLIVLKYVYLYRSEQESEPLPVTRPHAIALIVCVISIVVLGTVIAPWLGWTTTAASVLLN